MKKVNIVCVGRLKEKYISDGVNEYLKRLSRFCEVNVVELGDVAPPDEVRRESDRILATLGAKKAFVVLLDIDGELVTSPRLGEMIDRAFLTRPEVTFVIGGSEGVDDRVRAAADARVSFGRVTYPHQLMRLILAEQIYRAFSILSGTPYHK